MGFECGTVVKDKRYISRPTRRSKSDCLLLAQSDNINSRGCGIRYRRRYGGNQNHMGKSEAQLKKLGRNPLGIQKEETA